NQAKLKWTTASETNNKEFIVSRSADGKSFTEIGRVAGAGSSSILKDYVFYDTNPGSGINYYRLEQMDVDGMITIHGIRIVRFSLSTDVIKLYPNPTKNTLKIEFAAGKYQSLELVGNNGQVLQRIQLSIIENQKIINLSNQALGVYFVRLSGENTVVTRVVKE
ncbi:MAG: T9SS type A sorting domain-containing protein, partial [Ginsengibacter sp.]